MLKKIYKFCLLCVKIYYIICKFKKYYIHLQNNYKTKIVKLLIELLTI